MMKYVEFKDFTTLTMNLHTLYRSGHLMTAIQELKRYRLNIIGFQEKRWLGDGSLKTGNWLVFNNGTTEHQLGVGFTVNDNI